MNDFVRSFSNGGKKASCNGPGVWSQKRYRVAQSIAIGFSSGSKYPALFAHGLREVRMTVALSCSQLLAS